MVAAQGRAMDRDMLPSVFVKPHAMSWVDEA
jgi:hypothetical protein